MCMTHEELNSNKSFWSVNGQMNWTLSKTERNKLLSINVWGNVLHPWLWGKWKSKPDEIPSHPSQGDYENKPQQQKHPWLCSKKKGALICCWQEHKWFWPLCKLISSVTAIFNVVIKTLWPKVTYRKVCFDLWFQRQSLQWWGKHSSQHGSRSQKLRAHIFIHTEEAERANSSGERL